MVKKVKKARSNSSIDIRKTNIFDIKKEVATERLKKIRAKRIAKNMSDEKAKNMSDHFTECSARSEDGSERLFNLTLDSDSDSELTDNTNEMFEQIYQRAESSGEDPTFDELSSLSSDTVDPIYDDEDYPLPYDEIDIYFADPESFTEPEKIVDSAFSIRQQLFDEIRALPDFNVLKIKYLVLEEIRLFDRSKLKPANRTHYIRWLRSWFF